MGEQEIEGRDGLAQERGALGCAVMALALIALFGAPCFCYFGAGLVSGVYQLQGEGPRNPARERRGRLQRQRPSRLPAPLRPAPPAQGVDPSPRHHR